MIYTLRLHPRAEKDLAKLPEKDRSRILATLERLQLDPHIGKKLQGEYEGYFAVRVWPYRIIYTVFKRELVIVVVRIGHRQGIYK